MPSATNPSFSIAILTFNRAPILEKLLASLSEVVSDDVELIVVDNHSEDDTAAVVDRAPIPLVSVRTDVNVGVAGRNAALRRAKGHVVVCLDDDVFGIDRKALCTIREAFDSDPRIGAINFKVVDPWTNEVCNWVHHSEVEVYADQIFETYEITEGAVAFRNEAVAAAGWYPDSFFLSHEGPDLAFRLIDCGYRVLYRGDIVVKHWHANEGRRSWMTYYYDTRNQYWLAARNFPASYALPYLVRGQLSTLVYAIRDGYLRYWLRAVRDAIAGLRPLWRDRKVVSKETMKVIRAIDARRPSVFYMARKRLFQKEMRL
jgi:GT2 family glycosyltransferase